MVESLMISQGLLWIVVVILTLVCLALVRQVGVLYERIAPAGALAINKRLSGGDSAPPTTVVDIKGQPLSIAPINDKRQCQLLFFLSPTCPVCKTLLPMLKSIQQHEKSWLTIVLASDGDDTETHQKFIQKQALDKFTYVLSEPLGIAYGVSKLPYGVLIDGTGTISALGIINSREHLESLFEAKHLGQSTIQDYLQAQSDTQIPEAALVNEERAKTTTY